MNTKTILSFIVAITIALFVVNTASVAALPVTIGEVTVNDVDLTVGTSTTISGSPGETVPVTVRFTATSDAQDVKVKVGIGDSASVSTSRFDVLSGVTYVKRLSLTLPNVEDMDNSNETWDFTVTVSDKTGDEVSSPYTITMQRDAYVLDVLSAEMASTASAGEIVPIDVVLKNYGARDAEDTFVTVSIPELGVYKKAYFGDLVSQDNTASNDNEDARERVIYLTVPADVKSGDYTVEVKASNYKTTSTAKKVMSITGLAAANSTGTATPITSGTSKVPTSVIVLTVALVIIFVVLLIVLVVLLTKKPSEKVEDFGETSYY